jgi:hypothetical protein
MNVKQRQEIEQRIVRHLLREAPKIGYLCDRVNNGGGDERCATEREVIDAAFAADDAMLLFIKQLEPGHLAHMWVEIVLGNDGYDVIADHADPLQENSYGWNELMDRVADYAEAQDTR